MLQKKILPKKPPPVVVPLTRCAHPNIEAAPCPTRAWRKAESCYYFKEAERDFYSRMAGGPIVRTTATRGG